MKKLKSEKAFFDFLREGDVIGPVISNQELAGLKADLAACGAADWPLAWTAYAMATDYHETAGTMTPIKEYGSYAYFERMYGINGKNPERAKKFGHTKPGDGAKYCGRGRVQLTWKNNYAEAGEKLGVDLVNNPDKALDLTISSKIMIKGMEEGWFTGGACAHYLPSSGPAAFEQFVKARKIINGVDKAKTIASHALHFQEALEKGGWG